jgi:hypothetical protein
MPAKIFVSCGQRPGPEKAFCDDLKAWLTGLGFEVYIAIKIQSILDLNREIIGGLKASDYYLFINFKREKVRGGWWKSWRRGSVYTNQELAIALGEGIDHCLFINQRGARKEGIHEYLVSNVSEFNDTKDLLAIVQQAVADAGWSPGYSRHLCLARLRWSNPLNYADHTGMRAVRVLHGDILNAKSTAAAYGVIARLVRHGTGAALAPSADQSQLKASGFIGYEHTIFPKSEAPFDLLTLRVGVPGEVYLNSSMDLHPRNPIVAGPGLHRFEFEIVAQQFPKLRFTLELNVTDGLNPQPLPILL